MEKVQLRVNTPINHWRIQLNSQASRTIDTLVVTDHLVSGLILKTARKTARLEAVKCLNALDFSGLPRAVTASLMFGRCKLIV